MGLRRQRTMQRNDIRVGVKLLDLGVASANSFESGRVMQVKSNQFATKSSHDPSKDATDFASSDHSHGAANEIEAHEAVELKIAFASAIVGPRNLAIEREEQANGKLGHGVWRIVGDVHDFDAKGPCGSYVDLIETSGTRRDKLRTAGAELFEHHAIKEIVYKD